MYTLSKQIVAIGLPVAVVAVSGVAAAYWTSTGSGTGTAGTAAGAAALTVTQTATLNGLGPGVAAKIITVSVTNPGPASVKVNQVVASISSVSPLTGQTCGTENYTLADPTMTNGAADLAATTSASFSGATIVFNNTASNQDGCKGATVNLAYSAS